MPYTIKLDGGKYMVANANGVMAFWRYNEPWPSADLQGNGLVLAMAQRIEELEVAIKSVLDGPPNEHGLRDPSDGLSSFCYHFAVAGDLWPAWEKRLRNVLEQKP